jgi:hypothetical protein
VTLRGRKRPRVVILGDDAFFTVLDHLPELKETIPCLGGVQYFSQPTSYRARHQSCQTAALGRSGSSIFPGLLCGLWWTLRGLRVALAEFARQLGASPPAGEPLPLRHYAQADLPGGEARPEGEPRSVHARRHLAHRCCHQRSAPHRRVVVGRCGGGAPTGAQRPPAAQQRRPMPSGRRRTPRQAARARCSCWSAGRRPPIVRYPTVGPATTARRCGRCRPPVWRRRAASCAETTSKQRAMEWI